MRRFGLVRRVGGQELAFHGKVIDDGGDEVIVGPAAEEADFLIDRPILSGQLVKMSAERQLVQAGRDLQRFIEAHGIGDLPEQVGH